MKDVISIIVPVYNAEKTLDRCVKSLVSQTYPNIEIILVNDGSKDNSLALCRQYAGEDPRIVVIDKPNGGVSSARNTGLDAATGEFVMFCDSDDWVQPEWCRCLRDHYNPGDLVVCEVWREDVPMDQHSEPEEVEDRRNYMHHPMLMCCIYNKIFCTDVIRREAIRFSAQLNLGEDFVFCLEYLCAVGGAVRFIYQPLYNYDTSNANSLSGRAPALEQCEAFYQAVTGAMKRLGAEDPESIRIRDTFVAPHFERNLQKTAKRNDLSAGQKLRHAGKLQKLEGFRNTCRNGVRWGNPVYVRFMQRGNARAAMGLLLLADLRRQ